MSQSFWISIYIIWQCQLFVLYIKMGGGYNTFISNTKVLEHLFFKDFQIFSNKFLSLKLSAFCCFNFFRKRFLIYLLKCKNSTRDHDLNKLEFTHKLCFHTSFSFFGQMVFKKIFKRYQHILNNLKLSLLYRGHSWSNLNPLHPKMLFVKFGWN